MFYAWWFVFGDFGLGGHGLQTGGILDHALKYGLIREYLLVITLFFNTVVNND